MRPNSLFLKIISLLACTLLSHCTNLSSNSVKIPVIKRTPLASPYPLSAAQYLARAKQGTESEKQEALVLAAGRLITEGQWRQGQVILSQTSHLSGNTADKKNLLLARIDLFRDKPREALTHITAVKELHSMTRYEQITYHLILAEAYQGVGNFLESINERLKLIPHLPDEESNTKNKERLWQSLTSIPTSELMAMRAEQQANSELCGWLELALLARNHQVSPDSLHHWQARFPGHSGRALLSSLHPSIHETSKYPRQLAVLLPLTGALSGPGNAVKDGFMQAYTFDANKHIQVQFYNTDNQDVALLYQQVIREGADYVVGPLAKPDVVKVAELDHPVPTLLLNDFNATLKHNTYQFGLSPANEAKQVALKARQNGQSRALIIAPSDAWGNDVTAAFANQWQTMGGSVIEVLHYRPQDDLNLAIRHLLQVPESESRLKHLKSILGETIETASGRRQDFDMIFLLAYPSKARQIMPLLRYYFAGDIPVYGTSSVYAGSLNPAQDKDLDGLIFCDMPWVFTHQLGNKNWPEQFNSYNRLYALGMDSYSLTRQLKQLLLIPAMQVSNHSGILYLTPESQVARIPVWGKFQRGVARRTTTT